MRELVYWDKRDRPGIDLPGHHLAKSLTHPRTLEIRRNDSIKNINSGFIDMRDIKAAAT